MGGEDGVDYARELLPLGLALGFGAPEETVQRTLHVPLHLLLLPVLVSLLCTPHVPHTPHATRQTKAHARNTAHAHTHASKTCLAGRVWMMVKMTKRVVKTKTRRKRKKRRRRKGRGGGARPRGGCRRRGGRHCLRRLPAAPPSPRPRPAGAAFGNRWPPIRPNKQPHDTRRAHTRAHAHTHRWCSREHGGGTYPVECGHQLRSFGRRGGGSCSVGLPICPVARPSRPHLCKENTNKTNSIKEADKINI